MAAVRDAYGRDLDEIITDVPEIREMILGYLEEISPELKEKLRFYIPEFEMYEGSCRFAGCVHVNEPDCAVKKAVAEGMINQLRYDSYVDMYHELENTRKR